MENLEKHLFTKIQINKHFKYLLLELLLITFFNISGYFPKNPVFYVIF